MGKSQQAKGKVSEREVVNIIKGFGGFMARRGQVFNGEGDIVCPELPIWFEVKRHEELNIPEWFRQATKDCGNKFPSVVYRQSRKPWMITMRIKDFQQLISGIETTDSDFRVTMKFDEFMIVMKELFGNE